MSERGDDERASGDQPPTIGAVEEEQRLEQGGGTERLQDEQQPDQNEP